MESTDDAYVGGEVTVIAPKVPGFISQVAVTDNQEVHGGDLLLKLDDRDYRAALAKAEASVAMQEAAPINLDATHDLQEAMVAQAEAEAEIAFTGAETVRARQDWNRYQSLAADGSASVQNFQSRKRTTSRRSRGDRNRTQGCWPRNGNWPSSPPRKNRCRRPSPPRSLNVTWRDLISATPKCARSTS
jgi:membrane fusion protein (multidrug efflux system)